MTPRQTLAGRGATDGRDRGQATVELALALPVLCLLLLGVVQLAVVIRDQLVVIEAARAGVRAASVSADPSGAASSAATAAVGTGLSPISAGTSLNGAYVTVTVTMVSITDVPLIGMLLPDIQVQSDATMTLEPP